jgi:hypothetical protein
LAGPGHQVGYYLRSARTDYLNARRRERFVEDLLMGSGRELAGEELVPA